MRGRSREANCIGTPWVSTSRSIELRWAEGRRYAVPTSRTRAHVLHESASPADGRCGDFQEIELPSQHICAGSARPGSRGRTPRGSVVGGSLENKSWTK